MPRNFDSGSIGQGSDAPLVFTELVDCPVRGCGEEFDAVWRDDSLAVEDMTEAPRGLQVCPACGHEFEATFSGWAMFGEAG